MANISLRLLWLAFLSTLRRFFWIYTPQPLLSTFFPALIDDNPTFPPDVHVPDPSNTANLSSICPILPLGLTLQATCPVDYLAYDLHQVPLFESPHDYLFTDTLVRQPAEDAPPTVASPQVDNINPEDHDTQSNMTPYGARGLSFCPVMVGITYIQSLLHLYMLLMIPSLFHYWFEDPTAYDSDTTQDWGRGCGWFLYASVWTAPWCLVRYGLFQMARLSRRFKVEGRSKHLPVPRIVVVRVDGEAVPVQFSEDDQGGGDGLGASCTALESMDTRTQCIRDVRVDLEALSTRLVSQGDHQGGMEDGIGLVSPTTEGVRLSVTENPPALVETVNGPFRAVEMDDPGARIPRLDAPVSTPADFDVDEQGDEYGRVASRIDASLEERNELAFVHWSLINDHGLEEPETQSDDVGTSMGLQDTPSLTKNVRFVVGDDVGAEDRWHASLAHDVEECTHAGNELEDDGIVPMKFPAGPFSLRDTTPRSVLEERLEENDIVIVESLPPPSGEPIVELSPLVRTLEEVEEVRFVDADPPAKVIVPAAVIGPGMDYLVHVEDSEEQLDSEPLQTEDLESLVDTGSQDDTTTYEALNSHSLEERLEVGPMSTPTADVATAVDCLIGQQDTEPLRTESPESHCVADTFDWIGNHDDMTTSNGISDFASPEDCSYPPSPSVEGPSPVCSPRVESEQCLGNVRIPEIASTPSALSVKTELRTTNTLDTTPQAAIEVYATEVLYETPRCFLNGRDERSRNKIPGPEADAPDTAGPGLHWHTNLEPLDKSGRDDRAVGGEFDNMLASSTGLPPRDFATDSQLSERLSGLLDAGSEFNLLSAGSVGMITDEWNHDQWRDASSMARERADMTSRPPPKRTLSGSIHAPSASSLVRQTHEDDINQTTVIYETPSCPLSLLKPDEGTSAIAKNASEHRQGLSASIHAPQRGSSLETIYQTQDENGYHHRRVVTNPAVKEPESKPCPPNWAAMPEVIDAFHTFKQAPSGKTMRNVSSVIDYANRGPMLGIVGQKGIATHSLNNTSAIANIQGRWMHGRGLLLVRDVVPSDPVYFNLRPCTNLKKPNVRSTNAIAVQQMAYPVRADGDLMSAQRRTSTGPR